MSIQPQIDYTDVEAIPYQKTLSFVNNFIIKTTEFINRFSYLCEEKLSSVSRQLQRLEITMSLLEAKLTSIDDVSGGGISTASTTSPSTTGEQAGPVSTVTGDDVTLVPLQAPPVPPPGPGQPTEEVSNGAPDQGAEPTMTVSEDPRYTRYFKMLKMGVPLAHVQSKMMMEGHDPAILENPNAASDAQPEEKSDSLSSESDEAEWDEND